jgi:hypothetical protein
MVVVLMAMLVLMIIITITRPVITLDGASGAQFCSFDNVPFPGGACVKDRMGRKTSVTRHASPETFLDSR